MARNNRKKTTRTSGPSSRKIGDPGPSGKDWQKEESRDMRDNFRRRIREVREGKEPYDLKGKDNDVSWYVANDQLLRDFASFPFGYPLGSRLPSDIRSINNASIPGVMSLYFSPAVGHATDENAPVNIAMRSFFATVRKANSGQTMYDPPDLYMYLLAMDSVNIFYRYMRRAYGILRNYLQKNRYYPKALVTAMGLDYDDLVANMADFRGFINTYAYKSRSLAIPGTLSYFARHAWMCDNIYVDSGASAKAQTYLYTPSYVYSFGLDSQGAGALTLTRLIPASVGTGWMTGLKKLKDLISFGYSLINPLIANQDMNIMSGDILKALGEPAMMYLPEVPDDYVVLPVYSQEVLSQIENATVLTNATPMNNVSQMTAVGTGYLRSPMVVTEYALINGSGWANISEEGEQALAESVFNSVYSANRILNMHITSPTPADVMVATRLTNISDGTVTNVTMDSTTLSARLTFPTAGSEILTLGFMWYYTWDNAGEMTLSKNFITSNLLLSWDSSGTGMLSPLRAFSNTVMQISTFDWHPVVQIAQAAASSTDTTVTYREPSGYLMDVDNYTFIDEDNLKNMSLVALLSMLSYPMMS